MATILVLGAQGVLGSFAARALRADGHAILRGGRRIEPAEDFRLVDLDQPETLTAALSGVDLVVTAIEDPQVRAERQVLRAGGVIVSLATVPAAGERLLVRESAAGVRGSVVLNAGLSGVGALVVRDLLERHAQADEVEIAYIVSTAGTSGLAGVHYVHRLLTSTPHMQTTVLEFTPPRGRKRCFDLSANDEIPLAASVAGNRRLRSFVGVAESGVNGLLLLLNRIGLLARLPIALLAAGVKSPDRIPALTREPMRARFAVRRSGVLLEARGLESEGDYNSTVQATTVFAHALLDARLAGQLPAGLWRIEELLRLDGVRAALANLNIVTCALNT